MEPTAAGQDTTLTGPNPRPQTLHDAVDLLLSRLSPENLIELRNVSKEGLVLYLHGLGSRIRHDYGLWQGNEKLIASACGEPAHPDDASMKIIEALWNRLQDQR